MRCPFCGETESSVIDSRPIDDSSVVRRRRGCERCGRRFTTYERYAGERLMVQKRNGVRELFQVEKIRSGIEKACTKRPETQQRAEEIALSIAEQIRDDGLRLVETSEIGRRVMEALKAHDRVAYVRFASVYRGFEDIEGFVDAVEELSEDDA
jgi:transcriptional repressor NrdR